MNLVDLLIILLLIGAMIRGAEIGFVRQIFSAVGFFAGLFLGVLLQPKLIHLAHTPSTRAWLTLAITLLPAFILLGAGEYIGIVIKGHIQKHGIDRADRGIGSLVSGLTILVTAWLAAGILLSLPFPNLQSEVRSSSIISWLDRKLPSAPNTVARLGRLIYPNGFPKVFIGLEPAPPNPNASLPASSSLAPAVSKDEASVVKIEGYGCGGIVEGSGFIVANGLIATNAHVVAGITHPFVLADGRQYRSTPIWFDPNLDFAVLSVPGLSGNSLSLINSTATAGTDAAVLGYPGGGSFNAQPAVILDEFNATGRNIYNQGVTVRAVYEVKATVIPGNSGGPLIDSNGTVLGIVFAESTSYNQIGYVLTTPKLISELHQAEAQDQAVSTQSCAD